MIYDYTDTDGSLLHLLWQHVRTTEKKWKNVEEKKNK